LITKKANVWRRLVRRVCRYGKSKQLDRSGWISCMRTQALEPRLNFGRVLPIAFAKFHALLTDLVRGAWSRYVRQLNVAVLGEATDLNEFLFGSERISLAVVCPVLHIQNGRCFYCGSTLTPASTQVDTSSRGPDIQWILDITSFWRTASATGRSWTGCL